MQVTDHPLSAPPFVVELGYLAYPSALLASRASVALIFIRFQLRSVQSIVGQQIVVLVQSLFYDLTRPFDKL